MNSVANNTQQQFIEKFPCQLPIVSCTGFLVLTIFQSKQFSFHDFFWYQQKGQDCSRILILGEKVAPLK